MFTGSLTLSQKNLYKVQMSERNVTFFTLTLHR